MGGKFGNSLAAERRLYEGAIAAIIAAFWAEGPGGGHYETMRNSRYGAVGCGGYTAKGAFTLVQHFRTSK